MIFVSHDRTFLRGLSSRVLELGGETGRDRTPHVYLGSYVEYVRQWGTRRREYTREKVCELGCLGVVALAFDAGQRATT